MHDKTSFTVVSTILKYIFHSSKTSIKKVCDVAKSRKQVAIIFTKCYTDRQTDRQTRTHARTSDEVDPAKIDNRELKTVLLTDINHCKSSKRKAGFHKTT